MSWVAAGQPAGGASRTDRSLGIEEHFEFFGGDGQRLAGSVHRPLDGARASVLICPSICNDYIRNYRNEILLARALAGNGVTAARFDYRGTGNSDGDAADVSFTTMRDDALAAARWLGAAAPTGVVAVAGTRFGALVSASVAGQVAADAIVWVDPLLDGSRFFREAWRARLARAAKVGDAEQSSLKETLQRQEFVDILGHSVGRGLVRSVEGCTLLAELTAAPCPLLWVQLGGTAELTPASRAVVAELASQGFATEVRQVGDREPWWFLADDETPARDHLPVIEAWLIDRLTGDAE